MADIDDLYTKIGLLEEEFSADLRRLTAEVDELAAELEESRFVSDHTDYESWLDEVVRESEGRMMDGEPPGAILASLINELAGRHALLRPNERPLAV